LACTEHQNFFGVDDNLGPVAVSLRREKIRDAAAAAAAGRWDAAAGSGSGAGWLYLYRIIVRTSEVRTQCPACCTAISRLRP